MLPLANGWTNGFRNPGWTWGWTSGWRWGWTSGSTWGSKRRSGSVSGPAVDWASERASVTAKARGARRRRCCRGRRAHDTARARAASGLRVSGGHRGGRPRRKAEEEDEYGGATPALLRCRGLASETVRAGGPRSGMTRIHRGSVLPSRAPQPSNCRDDARTGGRVLGRFGQAGASCARQARGPARTARCRCIPRVGSAKTRSGRANAARP